MTNIIAVAISSLIVTNTVCETNHIFFDYQAFRNCGTLTYQVFSNTVASVNGHEVVIGHELIGTWVESWEDRVVRDTHPLRPFVWHTNEPPGVYYATNYYWKAEDLTMTNIFVGTNSGVEIFR